MQLHLKFATSSHFRLANEVLSGADKAFMVEASRKFH